MTKTQILKAIRMNCIYCMGDQPSFVEGCTSGRSCTLYPYRFGTDPNPNPKKAEAAKIRYKNTLGKGFGKKEKEAA
jgi:hypothetical protein